MSETIIFKQSKKRINIVIIGAGAAGIAAAWKLKKAGITNVTILEAENRIGGRIHSVFIGDAFVDLGAEEVHGEEGNFVFNLANEHLRKKPPVFRGTYYHSSGKKVDQELQGEVIAFMEDFCENEIEIKETIGQVFTSRYTSLLLNKYNNDPDKKKIMTEILPLCESFYCILEGPFSWFDVVMESGSHYVDCKGDQFIGWNGNGCKTILDILMNDGDRFPIRDQIQLNKVVNKIEWDTKSQVLIRCEDYSSYLADQVIWTPSVGVLRSKCGDIFRPHLPHEKFRVLCNIGFANVMKVVLKFPFKWWVGAPFGFVWSAEDTEIVRSEDRLMFLTPSFQSWLDSVKWLTESPDNDHVLVAWLTGPITPYIERLSEDSLQEGLMFVIRKFLSNHFEIPEPNAIISTKWYSNPNFRGAYSFETVAASKTDIPFQKILEQPLMNENGTPVVLFAGEATHLTQYSTVNGAILSGFREADRIINMYRY